MREAHEEEEAAYTSEGGYTLQEYSNYALSDNDERCGYIAAASDEDYPELLTDDSDDDSDYSDAEFDSDLPRPNVSKNDEKKSRAREMARLHSGLINTCEEWPAEEFVDNQDLEKLAKEMACHIIWQHDTTEVEEYLFVHGEREAMTPRDTAKRRNVFLRRSTMAKPRPKRTKDDNFCLTTYVEINGHKVFALFDSGCTTDSCSPDFARVSGMKVFPIETTITLTAGS
jgi:hypothetical protein